MTHPQPDRGSATPEVPVYRSPLLIVEDDDAIRASLRMALRDDGYIVSDVPDAESALDHMRRSPAELVLVDVMLPGMGTAIPAGTALAAVEVTDGVAVVDLSGEFAHMGGHEAVLAVAQLVLTLTDLDEVRAVALAIDGDPTAAPKVDGSLSQGPVTGGEYASLLRSGT